MNTNQLFEAIGEVEAKKLLHSEESVGQKKHRSLRFIGVTAAVLAVLTAFVLVANAATNGVILNELRMWLNGEPITAGDPRMTQMTDENKNELMLMEADPTDYEFIAAKTNETGELLSVERYHSSADGQSLGMTMQLNQVEEENGRIILFYGSDRIDITDQLSLSNSCSVDYSIYWDNVLQTHLLITIQRGSDGTYYVFTEPAK